MPIKGISKEGRFTQGKRLKADAIKEQQDLLHKLEAIYRDMQALSDEEIEALFPSVGVAGTIDRRRKRPHDKFVEAMIAAAHSSFQTTQTLAQYGIDVQNQSTQALLQQQAANMGRGQ